MSLAASAASLGNINEPTPFFNHASFMYGVTITCLILTTICTILRLYVRFFVTCRPGIDDGFVILLFLSTWAASIGSLILVNRGLGEHYVVLYLEGRTEEFSHTFWWSNATYNMSLTFVKLSLLTQYLRLFREHAYLAQMTYRRRLTMVLAVAAGLWGAAYSFLAWVPCVPVQGFWNHEIPAVRWAYGSEEEAPFVATFVSHATLNMAFDIAVLFVPISTWRIWSCDEGGNVRRKALIVLYVLGAIVLTCSTVRFIAVVVNKATTVPQFDPSWYGASAIVLSIVEINVATILAALPVFWPHLQERLNSIMITHEVEVNVSGVGFSEIKDDDDSNHDRSGSKGSNIWSGNHAGTIHNATTVVALHDLEPKNKHDRNNLGDDKNRAAIQAQDDVIISDKDSQRGSLAKSGSSWS
ncbi:hypothetical protein BD289DRAFT_157831 [Coniella lustricola]|uniref:Rhodopsin domain-containing protein n=1 Tax=Coniella lustricola TaxID=2025994 RepID=A0A2T3AMS0_9PEZI|nr:hypothetical protein BD289DRAFT_157831 [Coniella lustricola]